MKHDALGRFIQGFFQWLRRWLGGRHLPRSTGRLELATPHGALWQIVSDEPGVVACYRLCHKNASDDLLISLVGLAQLREDIARGGDRRPTHPSRATARSFILELDSFLESKGGLDSRFISHIVVVAWRSRIPRPMANYRGGDRRAYLVRPIASIPCDLQGAAFAWGAGDRYATGIVRLIARRLLLTTPTKYITWEEIIPRIDWVDWLTHYAQRAIGENHVLQPHKRQN